MSGQAYSIPSPDAKGSDSDTLATQEAKSWPQYEAISRAKTANTILVHKTIGLCIPIGIATAFLSFLILAGVYIAHLILRKDLRWLEPSEVQNIHNIIFSSVVGGAIAILAKSYFSDKPDGTD